MAYRNYRKKRFYRKRHRGRARTIVTRQTTGRWQKSPSKFLVGRLGTSSSSVAAPFPMKMYTVFSYSEDFSLTNTLAQTPVQYEFSGNSIYDPNRTGVGIQPRFYDTLLGANNTAAPYQSYTVLASKITVKAFGRNGSVANNPAFNGLISVTPQRTSISTTPGTITEMRERAFAKTRAVNSSQSWKPYTLKHYMKTKDIYGIKDTQQWETLDAQYNSNPGNQWSWWVSMCPVGQADTGMSFDFLVSIKYYVILTTFNDVADS